MNRAPRSTRLGICLAALLIGIMGGQASAAVPAGNLIQNPGAELGTPSGAPAQWTTAGNFRTLQYGAPGAAFSASIGGGANFFAGGSNDAVSTGSQTVDVSSAAAEIDAGLVTAQLNGYLGGYNTDPDTIRVAAETQAADAGAPFTEALAIGPVTAADRGNQETLLPRSGMAAVPAGTRRIRVTATATRFPNPGGGAYANTNDGWADNLSLVLTARPGPTTGGGATPVKVRRKGVVKGIKSPGRRVKGKVSVAAPCKAGRRVVIKKGSKTVGTGRTKSSGSFNIKTKKHKKGKLTVKISERTVGNTTCRAISKKVPGRN